MGGMSRGSMNLVSPKLRGNRYVLALPMAEEDEAKYHYTQAYIDAKGDKRIYKRPPPTQPLEHSNRWIFHKLPLKVYTPKDYPTCKCGRKYVPVKRDGKWTTECYYCRIDRNGRTE